jgi:hypothetical protein
VPKTDKCDAKNWSGIEPTGIAQELWTQAHSTQVSASLPGGSVIGLVAASTLAATEKSKPTQLPGLPT